MDNDAWQRAEPEKENRNPLRACNPKPRITKTLNPDVDFCSAARGLGFRGWETRI